MVISIAFSTNFLRFIVSVRWGVDLPPIVGGGLDAPDRSDVSLYNIVTDSLMVNLTVINALL